MFQHMSFRYCPSLLTGVRQRSGYVQALVLSRILTARPNALYISRGLHQCRIRLTSMMVVTHAMKLGLTRSILCPLPALSQTCQRRARCLFKGDSHESAQLSSAQLSLPCQSESIIHHLLKSFSLSYMKGHSIAHSKTCSSPALNFNSCL